MGKSEKRWYPLRGDFQEEYKNKMSLFETGFSPECAITEEQALEMLRRENIIKQIAAPIPPFEQTFENQECRICIEDPFETNVNVSRTSDYGIMRHLRSDFKRAFSILNRKGSKEPLEWLLFSQAVDPSGQFPAKNYRELKQKQREIEQGKNVVVQMNVAKPKFCLSERPVESDSGRKE